MSEAGARGETSAGHGARGRGEAPGAGAGGAGGGENGMRKQWQTPETDDDLFSM